MNKIELTERSVYLFQQALLEAGMTYDFDHENVEKSKFYRNYIPDSEIISDNPTWLVYAHSDQINHYADNKVCYSENYFESKVMSRNDYADSNFQDLKSRIENALEKNGFRVTWDHSDGIDTGLAVDTPIYYTEMSANITLDSEGNVIN